MEEALITQPSNKAFDKDGLITLSNLSTADRQNCDALAKQLNENDANAIVNFGAELQNQVAKQSDTFLNSVRSYNSGEVGTLITDLLTELNYIDVDEMNQSRFKHTLSKIPLLGKLVKNVERIFQEYDKITANVDKISMKVRAGMINSAKDNAALQTMFEGNVKLIKDLETYIMAGKIKWDQLNTELAVMDGNPAQYEDYQISDKRNFASRLDKRLADMKIVRFIMMQSLAQIRVVQNNNTSIAEKAQSILTTTLPVWRNQLTLAVALQRQKQNIEVQRQVSETTNTILRKNAEMLQQNSVAVAQENEQTIVSLDTLRETTKSLIDTLTEVKQIHDKGTESRRELDKNLEGLETELRKGVIN